jgi:hypothetical protein
MKWNLGIRGLRDSGIQGLRTEDRDVNAECGKKPGIQKTANHG